MTTEPKAVEVIENTEEARDNSTAGGHGHTELQFDLEHIDALLNGKSIMIDVNLEYSICITGKPFDIPDEYKSYLSND